MYASSRESVRSRTLVSLVGTLLLAFLLMPLPRADAQSLTFDTGHVDAFNVTSESGELNLNLKEDVTGQHVIRDPESVVLKVKEEAWTEKTSAIIGAPTYFLPQTQDQNLLWPGWDTLGAQKYFKGAIDINFLEVQGPGEVHMWVSGTFGEASSPLTSESTHLTSGSTIRQNPPAHVHTNWGFTQAGTYTMTVQAEGTNIDGSHEESNTATYTWVVGHGASNGGTATDDDTWPSDFNENDGDDGQLNGTPAGNQNPSSNGNPQSSGSSKSANSSFYNGTKPRAADNKQTTQAQGTEPGNGGQNGSDKGQKCKPALKPMIKDDRQQPATWVDPGSLTFGLGSAAKKDLPMKIGPVDAGLVHMIGSTQEPNVPWLGANTQHPSVIEHTTGEVVWDLTSFEGPGNMVVYTQGNLGQVVGEEWFSATPGNPSGSHTVPANTHVHQNWVFSEPGTYKVGITQSATLKDGGKISSPATLTFNVGGAGNADDGHFDFGAIIEPEGDCGGGAGGAGGSGASGGSGGGSGASGGTSSGSGQLANTGVDNMTAALGLLGLGVIVLGASYMYTSRVRQVQ